MRRSIAALLALVTPVLASRTAQACSVCLAGDPVFSTHGASSQEVGSFSLYLEGRAFRKTSGLLPHGEGHEEAEGLVMLQHPGHDDEGGGGGADPPGAEEHDHGSESSRGQRLDLFASWTPLDRWTFTLDLPFAWNRIEEEEHGETTLSTLSGFGDVSLGSSFVFWRNREVLPSTWTEARLWVKAPTGRDETKVDGKRDPHLQPGTGSWDFGAGLAAAHRLAWGALYASVFYRENTEGSLDYTYGDVILANAALEVPLGHAFAEPALSWLTTGLELNFRYAGYDRQDGESWEDSGGAIVYATPSLRFRLPWGVGEQRASLRSAVQIPLLQTWLHNEQQEKEVWSVGLLVPF
jgi:hypothetical protein